MPKSDRNGQADIWLDEQFDSVLMELRPERMKALFAICYYCGCRVSEARQLKAEDVMDASILFRRSTTKTQKTREVPISSKLRAMLEAVELPSSGYLFPGRSGDRPVTRQACDLALRRACDYLGLKGFSTHSNRRTFATRLDRAGVRLKTIQSLGGWESMQALQRYLDVSEEEKVDAIAML